MKRLLLIALLLVGCGQDFKIDTSNTTISWQGYINESPDPYIMQYYEEMVACTSSFGYHRDGYPYLVIVADSFSCNGALKNGCTDFSSIYLAGIVDGSAFYIDSGLLQHEMIHWITFLTDFYHSNSVFQICAY